MQEMTEQMAKIMRKTGLPTQEFEQQNKKPTENDNWKPSRGRYRGDKGRHRGGYGYKNEDRYHSYGRRRYEPPQQQYYYMQPVQPQIVQAMPPTVPTQTVTGTTHPPTTQSMTSGVPLPAQQQQQQQGQQPIPVPVQHVTYQQPPQLMVTSTAQEDGQGSTSGEQSDE